MKPEDRVYVDGRWVPASEVAALHRPVGRMRKARQVLARRVVEEILRSPGNRVRRGRLRELSSEVAGEMGLKRLGYRFLITQGIIGRPPGSKLYYLTEKAKQLYPDLFER